MRRRVRTAGRNHLVSPIQKLFNVDTHRSCRGQTKVRERRIAATDAGDAQEDFAKAITFRFPPKLGTRIGNRDEAIAGLVVADYLSGALEKILLEDIRLEGRARFARNNKHCVRHFYPVLRQLASRPGAAIPNCKFRTW